MSGTFVPYVPRCLGVAFCGVGLTGVYRQGLSKGAVPCRSKDSRWQRDDLAFRALGLENVRRNRFSVSISAIFQPPKAGSKRTAGELADFGRRVQFELRQIQLPSTAFFSGPPQCGVGLFSVAGSQGSLTNALSHEADIAKFQDAGFVLSLLLRGSPG
jgi:hypothetical protein